MEDTNWESSATEPINSVGRNPRGLRPLGILLLGRFLLPPAAAVFAFCGATNWKPGSIRGDWLLTLRKCLFVAFPEVPEGCLGVCLFGSGDNGRTPSEVRTRAWDQGIGCVWARDSGLLWLVFLGLLANSLSLPNFFRGFFFPGETGLGAARRY